MTLCSALTKNDLLSLIFNKHFHSCTCEVDNFFKKIYSLMDVSNAKPLYKNWDLWSLMGVSINLYLLMKEMFHSIPDDVGIVTCMHTWCTWLYADPTHLPSICPFTRPQCWSVPYPCTFYLYFGLGSVCPPLTFWAHISLLHWQFLLLLQPLAPCRNTCLPPSL